MKSFVLSLAICVASVSTLQAGECANGGCLLPVKNAVVKVVEAPVHLAGNVVKCAAQTTKNVVGRVRHRTRTLFGRLRCL
jgi:hypothetical protein